MASDAIPSNSSDKGSQKKLNKSIPLRLFRPRHHNPPENRLAPGNRLALGSGTDVKSRATFSSGPDPSVRQQAQMVAQKKFLTPLRPQYVKKRRYSPKYLELQLFLVTFATK